MKEIIVAAAISLLVSMMTVTVVLPMAVDAYMKRRAEAAMMFLQHMKNRNENR